MDETLYERVARLSEEERQRRLREDGGFDAFVDSWVAKALGKDKGIDGTILRLREATYQLHDGRSVYYDDGHDTVRDAADLYTVLDELHDSGSPNLENAQAREILTRLQDGTGLGTVHLNALTGLLAKHKDAIEKLRATRDRDGQDLMNISAAPQGAIVEPAKLPRTQEAERFQTMVADSQWEEHAARRLRESAGEEHVGLLDELIELREAARSDDLLAALGIDPDDVDALSPASTNKETPPARSSAMSLREAVVFGELTLLEAITQADARREALEKHDGDLLSKMGIDQRELEG